MWRHVNKVLSEKGESRSRASIIFFLDDMVEEGVLDYEVTTGMEGPARAANKLACALEFTYVRPLGTLFTSRLPSENNTGLTVSEPLQ